MMASFRTQVDILKSKMEKLLQEKDNVFQQLGDYVDQVIRSGQSWIDSKGKMDRSFHGLSLDIESSIILLAEVTERLEEAASSSAVPPSSPQPAAMSAPSTSSGSASSGPSLEEQIECLQHRMDTLENTGNSLHHVVSATQEKVGELDRLERETNKKTEENENRLKQMEDKSTAETQKMMASLQQMEDKCTAETQKMDDRLKKIEDKRTAEALEMGKRLSQLEEWRVRMEKTVTDLGKLVEDGAAVGEDRGQAGFQATLPAGHTVHLAQSQTLTCMTEVTLNPGDRYDLRTVIYTVPVRGRYRVRLNHRQEWTLGEGRIGLRVIHESRNPGSGWGGESEVCDTWTRGKGCVGPVDCRVQDSSEKVIEMGVGDRLWVKVVDVWSGERLVSPSGVSCVLVEKL